jgi:hypothetical protein
MWWVVVEQCFRLGARKRTHWSAQPLKSSSDSESHCDRTRRGNSLGHNALTQGVFVSPINHQIVVQYVADFAVSKKLTKNTTVQPMHHCRGFHKGHFTRQRDPIVDTHTWRQIIDAVAAARRAIED